MEYDIKSTVKTIWEDIELSQMDKEQIELSELYLTKIYPSQILSNDLACKVNFPEYIQNGWLGFQGYYEYEIISTINSEIFHANRRYSDFEEFHKLLITNFPGFNVPPLPNKTLFKYHDKEILRSRRSHIEFYLNYIANHFLLKNSEIFKQFLQNADFYNPAKLKSSNFFLTLEQIYDKKYAEFSVKIDVLLCRRTIVFEEKLGKIYFKLEKSEKLLEDVSSRLKFWIKSFDSRILGFDSIRIPGFCDWIYDITIPEAEYLKKAYDFEYEVFKELLIIKGLKNAIHCLKNYKIKLLEITTQISRVKEKYETKKHEKYLKDIENLENYLIEYQKKISLMQDNIQKEYSIYKNIHNSKWQTLIENTIKNSLQFYEKCSLILLNIKHNVN